MTLLKVSLMEKPLLLSSKILFSRREFSTLTGLSLRTIAKLIASGELRSIRVGRRRLVRRAELDRFIARDHRISAPSRLTLRRRSKKRKHQKSAKNRKFHREQNSHLRRPKKKSRKNRRTKHSKPNFLTKHKNVVDPRVVRALAGCGKNMLSQQFLGRFESFGSFRAFET